MVMMIGSEHVLDKAISEEVLRAASEGDEEALIKAVEGGANLEVMSDKIGEQGLGPLHLAAWGGQSNALKVLLMRTLNREAEAKGRRPFHYAALGGHVDALKVLKNGGCNVHALTADGSSALHLAADYGNLEAVQWLVEEAGLMVNLRDDEGHTAKHLARTAGHRQIHKYLKARTELAKPGMDAGLLKKDKVAEVAADGDVANLTRLLKEGAAIDLPSTRDGEEGLSAVHLAAWGGHAGALKTLISHGAHLEAEAEGRRPVHYAAVGGHVDALKVLKKGGCDLQALTADGSSALHLAADNGNLEAVQWLVEEAGLKVDEQDGEGRTAKHLARTAKHCKITKFLLSKNPIDFKGYTVVDILGCGGFGEAYLVEKEQKKRVLKVIEQGRTEKGRSMAVKELELMQRLSHPSIVAFKDGRVTDKAVFILTEYCKGGDLLQRIRKNKEAGTKIEERKILKWCRNVTEALKYLHEQHIIHRDVKPNNIFLTGNDVAKLGDLGVASVMSEDTLPMNRAGTEAYMSPEVSNEEPYDASADMWSLGCCLYELAALQHGRPYVQVDVPGKYSENYKDLVKSLLQDNPQNRPSAASLLTYPIFVTHSLDRQMDIDRYADR